MTALEITWTPEMLAKRRRIVIIAVVTGLSILGLILYKLAIYQWRNEMLLSAAMNNDPKWVQDLLEKGANCRATDTYGNSTLMRAAGREDAVKLLLEKCTNISLEEKTALLLRAASMNYMGTVKVLLEKRTDISERDLSQALMAAAEKGHFGVASLLVEKGADTNAKDREGKNALMLACEHREYALAMGHDHLKIIRLLLEKGADVNAMDNEGWTALKRAERRGSKEIVELLKARGAKE
jgi:ankyrin repeat protein